MTVLINKTDPKGFRISNQYIHPDAVKIIAALSLLPEIEQLSNLIENNPYHPHENVLDHVQTVFANCQELLKFDFIKSDELRKKYLSYFQQVSDKTGKYKRNDLLLLAIAVHDVGKGTKKENGNSCFEIIDEQGTTKAAGHEHVSAMIVPQLFKNSDLTIFEISIVKTLVDCHDDFSETFCRTNLIKDVKKDIVTLQQRQPLFYAELLVHILSDNAGAEIYKQWSDYFINEILQEKSFLKL